MTSKQWDNVLAASGELDSYRADMLALDLADKWGLGAGVDHSSSHFPAHTFEYVDDVLVLPCGCYIEPDGVCCCGNVAPQLSWELVG